jgi:hypothetical protein
VCQQAAAGRGLRTIHINTQHVVYTSHGLNTKHRAKMVRKSSVKRVEAKCKHDSTFGITTTMSHKMRDPVICTTTKNDKKIYRYNFFILGILR